jgi:hypothetical protein
MRVIGLIFITALLSACGAHSPMNEFYVEKQNAVGFTNYDPPSGDWIFIRNEPFAAQRHAKRLGWKWGDPNPPW